MSFIAEARSAESDPAVAAMYADERTSWGYLPNYARLFSHEPSVMSAWRRMSGAVRGAMDRRRFELVTMAAAQARASSYCSLAHGKFLADLFHTPDEVAVLAGPEPSPVADDVDCALIDFARQVATDPAQIDQGDVDRLRGLGLDDREIFLVVAAVGARCFFATVLDALGAQPDAQLGSLAEPMRRELTVGRAIASEPSRG
jgi:uncharacterized peroxidase-related enzyme